MSAYAFYDGQNSMVVGLHDLRGPDGTLINDAEVAVTIRTPGGMAVVGGPAWPAPVPPVGGGRYQLVLPTTLQLQRGSPYEAVFRAHSDGLLLEITADLLVQLRKG